MDIKQLKKLLLPTLDSIDQEKYVVDPKRDFIRQRKLSFKDTLLYILSMGGGTILCIRQLMCITCTTFPTKILVLDFAKF